MSTRFLLTISVLFFLAACVDLGAQKPAPYTVYGQSSGGGSAGVHNVIAGDTLYTVSRAYRLPMRDIVVLNKLKAPFALRDGMRLRLPPPQEYTVRQGDTIYDVSRLFGVNSNEIVRLNNLNVPYSLRSGQVLRLPSVTRRTQMAARQSEPFEKSVVSSQKPSRSFGVEREVLKPPTQVEQKAVENIDAPPMVEDKPMKTRVIERVSGKIPSRESSKFLRPVSGRVISGFGPKESGLHNDGINIAAEKGTSVKAAENGVVVYAGNELKGSGNLILLRHEDQWVTAYAHLDRMDVRKGDVVDRGDMIGAVGSTGSVSEPQLHFEIRRGTDAINPKNYLED